MQAVRSLLRNPIVQNSVRRAYHDTGAFKPASMNELPVPCGSWQEHYNKKQSKYNVHLIVGVTFTIITLAVAKASGLVYLNYYPPESVDDEVQTRKC